MERWLWGGVLGVVGSLLAQQPLTLERAVRLALERNPDVLVSRLEVQRADARVREAIGTALPSLSVAAGYNRNIVPPVFFLPDFQNPNSGRLQEVRIGSDNAFQVQLQLGQVLFSQAVLVGIGASRLYAEAARQQYRAVAVQTVASVKKAFYAALLSRELLEAAQASLQRAERFAQDVGVLASQGLVADYDALRARVQLEQIRTVVAQAQFGYAAALRNLKLLIGLQQEELVELAGDLEAEYRPADLPTEPELIERVLRQNIQLQALRLQEQVQQEVVRIYQAESYPTVVGFGGVTYQGQSPTWRNFVTAVSSVVGIQLSISLFQGLQTAARVEQAELEQRKVQQQRERLQEALKLQILLVRQQALLAQQRLEAHRSAIRQAERGYEIALTRYSTGLGSQLEVLDADAAIRQARSTYAQALHDYLVAQAELEALTGRIDPRIAPEL